MAATKRTYRMQKRADDVEQTRRRITEAAVVLHTTVGPSRTTIKGLAEKAGVTRVTVYRHFPDDETLFNACQAHWLSAHPPPDPSRWPEITDVAARIRRGLTEQYAWFRHNAKDLFPIYRDVEATPASALERRRAAQLRSVDVLLDGSGLRGRALRRARAALLVGLNYWTWRSLVLDQELSDAEAVAVSATSVLAHL